MYTEQDFKNVIREIPDFPKEGILFYDITTLLKDPDAYQELITQLADSLRDLNVDLVIGPEARGFVIGSAVAYAIGAGFVLARKPGKLPAEVFNFSYGLEYGSDCLEIHKDAIQPGQRIAIVDDLLATGGTALATIKLAEQMGAEVVGARFAIELTELGGRELLQDYDVGTVIKY
ncbi:MAG: adenine phosphoribosyltransferase [Clostridia bacterium]|nr:adenine phosphoribosyltransferase [Clostridia bacterium]